MFVVMPEREFSFSVVDGNSETEWNCFRVKEN